MKRYLLGLSIITIIITILLFLAKRYFLETAIPDIWGILSIFFFGISTLSHFLLTLSVTSKPQQFSLYFLMASVVKLLVYLIFLLIYFRISNQPEINFLITFAAYYIIYTFFDLSSILKTIKKKDQEGKLKNQNNKDIVR